MNGSRSTDQVEIIMEHIRMIGRRSRDMRIHLLERPSVCWCWFLFCFCNCGTLSLKLSVGWRCLEPVLLQATEKKAKCSVCLFCSSLNLLTSFGHLSVLVAPLFQLPEPSEWVWRKHEMLVCGSWEVIWRGRWSFYSTENGSFHLLVFLRGLYLPYYLRNALCITICHYHQYNEP